jgi:hypothetical protein
VLPVWRLRRAAYRRRSVSSAESCRPAIKSPGTAVIRAIVSLLVGVLLVSSGVAPVGTIGPANASPASAADAKPLAARSRPEIQRSVLENSDRAAALGLLLLREMADSRRGW